MLGFNIKHMKVINLHGYSFYKCIYNFLILTDSSLALEDCTEAGDDPALLESLASAFFHQPKSQNCK